VIVLDIMLPGRDRLSILRQWREQQNATPVLLLSARGEVTERIVITLNHELRQGPQSSAVATATSARQVQGVGVGPNS